MRSSGPEPVKPVLCPPWPHPGPTRFHASSTSLPSTVSLLEISQILNTIYHLFYLVLETSYFEKKLCV